VFRGGSSTPRGSESKWKRLGAVKASAVLYWSRRCRPSAAPRPSRHTDLMVAREEIRRLRAEREKLAQRLPAGSGSAARARGGPAPGPSSAARSWPGNGAALLAGHSGPACGRRDHGGRRTWPARPCPPPATPELGQSSASEDEWIPGQGRPPAGRPTQHATPAWRRAAARPAGRLAELCLERGDFRGVRAAAGAHRDHRVAEICSGRHPHALRRPLSVDSLAHDPISLHQQDPASPSESAP
jgi:hypothetical protein